jgi:FMN phosphatase YigB (HAD superfamily)
MTKYAFIDLDGTLVRLQTDYDAIKRATNVSSIHDIPREQYDVIEKFELDALNKATCIIEAPRLLSRLVEEKYTIVIVTINGIAVSDILMRQFFPTIPVEAIIGRESVQHHKPDLRHITELIHHHNISPESILIGDSEHHDAKLAAALSLRYFNSVSSAMKGLGYRQALHSNVTYADELHFLQMFTMGTSLNVGCGGRPDGDVNIDDSAEHLPFGDKTFDAVWFIHSLEHINKFNTAIREAWRVLRPGGRLGVIVPVPDMAHFDKTHVHIKEWTDWVVNILEAASFMLLADRHFYTVFDDELTVFSHGIIFEKV